ncbi:MAG: polysaccharide deacetylase family protein [Acidobacteriota bacterium]|nr:polysaccharide deacetylase family protein [Acidobacteriota bacterium]
MTDAATGRAAAEVKLSVIVPTHNRCAILRQTVPTLLAQDVAAETFEILVVLDACTDGTAEYLGSLHPACAFRVLQSPRRGPSAARNAGIQSARGELVLLLDDDFLCPENLFRLHCGAHSTDEDSVVHGRIQISPRSAPTIVRYDSERFYERYYNRLDPDVEVRYPCALAPSILVLSSMANASLPRQALVRAGGFDEQVFAAEDFDLGLSLWKMGLTFRYSHAASVREIYSKSSVEFLRWQDRTLAAGDLRISRKHPEYRACCSASSLAEARGPKRWLRHAVACLPLPLVSILALPLRFERIFYPFPALRKLALPLLENAKNVTRVRSVVRAAGSWQALQAEFGRLLPVLMYHHVGPLRGGPLDYLTVTPENFDRQMQWLARRGYTAIRSSDWVRWRREGKGLPEKPVLITFDDGYAETAQNAFPVLRRYGFSGLMFVVTQLLGKDNAWDREHGAAPLPLMTAEEIRRWDAEGIEFGAHSRTHADLTALSVDAAREEMRGSRQDLEALLGHAAASFAYPYGRQNAAIQEVARREFEIAFSVDEGLNYLRSDGHMVRRAYVGPFDSMPEFAWIVRHGTLGAFRKLRGRLGLRRKLARWLQR